MLNDALALKPCEHQTRMIESLLFDYRESGTLTPRQCQMAMEIYAEIALRGKRKIIVRGGNHKWKLDEQSKFR